jgi:Transposase DDE domain
MGLFLEAQGHPLPQHSPLKSLGALSRFLNQYDWSTRQVIRTVRQAILNQLLEYRPRGRRPWLQVIVDLTTLEKCGKFKAFGHLIHILQGKRGLHLVVLYLVVGCFRVPWGFRVWRGKGKPSAAHLAIRLMDTLPQQLIQAFQVVILADTAFGSVEFLKAMRKRRYAVIVGVRCDRKLADGRQVCDLGKKGQQVKLDGFPFPVTISWLYLKRDGKLEKRFVLSTRPLKGSTITWWGRRRWSIEGFFKTAKHRFGLHRFGQQTLLGVYRWFILCLISFILAHWVYLSTGTTELPDWGKSAALALKILLPQVLICLLLIHLEQSRSLLQSVGLDLRLIEVKT